MALLVAASLPGLLASEPVVAEFVAPPVPASPIGTKPLLRKHYGTALPAAGATLPARSAQPPMPKLLAIAAPHQEELPVVPSTSEMAWVAGLPGGKTAGGRADTGTTPAALPIWPAQGGPPQPTVGPRRDIVDTPLLDDQAWQSWVFAVRLNGDEVSQGSLFVENKDDGRLLATVVQLRAWRVRLDETLILTMQGEPYYSLDAIPGAQFSIDRDRLALTLAIPPDQLEPSAFDSEMPVPPAPQPGKGGFLDYDILLQAGNGVARGAGSLFELGAFGEFGVMTTSLQATALDGGASVARLDTTLTRDLPAERTSLRLGDSLTFGGAFAQPIRFGGLQWATNFSVDPAFVTFPTPAIGGLADQQSVVDVFVNNMRQATGEVPPGPFRIGSIPVVTGAGEVQLVVRDLLGRERIVTQPYYVSARLLREGLHDFSYAAGFERRRYGDRSFDYGDPLLSATHRYGLSDTLTLEAHLDAEPGGQVAAGGGSLRLGNFGVLSGGVGAGQDSGSPGALADIAYEYQSSRFSFGLRTAYQSDELAHAGSGSRSAGRVDQLNLGVELGPIGRVGLLAINQDSSERENFRSAAVTYSLRVGTGNLMLRAARLVDPDDEYALMALYSIPLGNNRSSSIEVGRTNDGPRARAQFRQGRGANDLGLDYRLAAEVGHEAEDLDARFSYQTTRGAGELELERFDGDNNLRAGLTGSVGLVDGKVQISRRLGQAFGMVSTPGFPNVRVYLDNREIGRTDEDGKLILPDLRPYEANRVRLEVDDLPLDAQVGTAEAVAVPFARSGVTVGFDVRRERQATARLLDAEGVPLPAGLKLTGADGAVWAWVAKDGFAQIAGTEEPAEATGTAAGRSYACTIPRLPADEILPELGELRCR